MARNSAVNLDIDILADGMKIGGGSVDLRKLGLAGGDVDLVADAAFGTNEYLFPDVTGDTLVVEDFAQTLTNKTIDADLNTITNIGDPEVEPGLISDQVEITTVDTANDYLLIWDATDSDLKKVAPGNLGISGSSGDPDQNLFETFAVTNTDSGFTWGTSNVVADSITDTLTLVGGSDITIESDAASDAIRITYSGSSSGLTNAYQSVTDGTSTATASGGDTLQFNSSDSSLTITADDASTPDSVDFVINSVDWSLVTSTPTSLGGYGIVDAYTQTQLQTAGQSSVHWNNLTNVPTFDNYGYWTVSDGSTNGNVTSQRVISFEGSGAVITNYNDSTGILTISSSNDNYQNWIISDDAGTPSTGSVGSGRTIQFAGSGATSVEYNDVSGILTISSTDNDTTYSGGDGIDITSQIIYADVKNSIEIDTKVMQLVNDVASPGNSKYYGTDDAGTKGWFDLPSGSGMTSFTITDQSSPLPVSDGYEVRVEAGTGLQVFTQQVVGGIGKFNYSLDAILDDLNNVNETGKVDTDFLAWDNSAGNWVPTSINDFTSIGESISDDDLLMIYDIDGASHRKVTVSSFNNYLTKAGIHREIRLMLKDFNLGASAPTSSDLSLGSISPTILLFSNTTSDNMYIAFKMPDTWDGSEINVRLEWTGATTPGTDNSGVRWSFKAIATSEGDDVSVLSGTYFGLNAVLSGQYIHETDTIRLSSGDIGKASGHTLGGGDVIFLEIKRDTSFTHDDYSDDAILFAVTVQYKENESDPLAWL